MADMFGRKKLKLMDIDNTKLDTAIVSSDADVKGVLARWKKKGFL